MKRFPIKGWEGFYEITKKGDVFSIPRIVRRKSGIQMRVPFKKMKQFLDSFGYLRVSLTKNGETKIYSVHRLLAETFLKKPDIKNRDEVDHINRIRSDNRMSNLRWVSCNLNKLNAKISSLNTSGATGVVWCKCTKKWRAIIKFHRKTRCLGRYKNFDDACRARKKR